MTNSKYKQLMQSLCLSALQMDGGSDMNCNSWKLGISEKVHHCEHSNALALLPSMFFFFPDPDVQDWKQMFFSLRILTFVQKIKTLDDHWSIHM